MNFIAAKGKLPEKLFSILEFFCFFTTLPFFSSDWTYFFFIFLFFSVFVTWNHYQELYEYVHLSNAIHRGALTAGCCWWWGKRQRRKWKWIWKWEWKLKWKFKTKRKNNSKSKSKRKNSQKMENDKWNGEKLIQKS